MAKNNNQKKSIGSPPKANENDLSTSKAIKCKISDFGCVYHACGSDDCQKRHVIKNGIQWGNGNCKKK